MIEKADVLGIASRSNDLDELDLAIARLALLCNVKILDSGIVERVLRKDASVCGTNNPAAFRKLHDLLMMHFVLMKKTVDALGAAQAAEIERHIVDRLNKRFGDSLGKWPTVAKD